MWYELFYNKYDAIGAEHVVTHHMQVLFNKYSL